MEDLIQFMEERFKEKEKDLNEGAKIWIKLDELRRVKITCTDPGFDIGLSDPLLRLLGLSGHPYVHLMTLEGFEMRQRHRTVLDLVLEDDWRKERMNRAEFLRKIENASQSWEHFGRFISQYRNGIAFQRFMQEIKRFRKIQKGEEVEKDEELSKIVKPPREEDEGRYQWTDEQLWQKMRSNLSQVAVEAKDVLGKTAEELYFDDEKEVAEIRAGGLRSGMKLYEEALRWIKYHLLQVLKQKSCPPVIRGIIPGNLNPVERMFIYTNIIEPVDFNDGAVKLLKLVNTKGQVFRMTQEEFMQPIYFPVQKGKISRIEVLITDDQGSPVSFQVGTVILTLHFRRRVTRASGGQPAFYI
jgi:hypothetical protein